MKKQKIDNRISSRLKQIRKERGLDQQTIALIMKLPRTAITQIESGNRDIYGDEIYRLCKALNLSADWLLTGNL